MADPEGRSAGAEGLVVMCAHCFRLRGPQGLWCVAAAETLPAKARISHGICPECYQKHYPEDDVPPGESLLSPG